MTVPLFRGVLPQLAAGIALLVEQRLPSGLWFEDPWLSSKVLRSLASYNRHVETTDGMASLLNESVEALGSWLRAEAARIEGATDLYPGLDNRLRSVCSCYVTIREVGGPSAKEPISQVEPAILNLLKAGAEYAAAIGDLVVAGEVLECISLLSPERDEAAHLSEPWLTVVTRAMIKPSGESDRVRALVTLLGTGGSIVQESARAVWTREADRMLPPAGRVPFEQGLAREGKLVADQLKEPDLETLSLVARARTVRNGQTSSLPDEMTEDVVGLLLGRVAAFRSETGEHRAEAIRAISTAIKVLSESSLARIVAFPTKEEDRVTKAVALVDRMERGEAVVVSHSKYLVLQAIGLILVWVWAVTLYLWQPTHGVIIGLTAALLSGLVALAFRQRL